MCFQVPQKVWRGRSSTLYIHAPMACVVPVSKAYDKQDSSSACCARCHGCCCHCPPDVQGYARGDVIQHVRHFLNVEKIVNESQISSLSRVSCHWNVVFVFTWRHFNCKKTSSYQAFFWVRVRVLSFYWVQWLERRQNRADCCMRIQNNHVSIRSLSTMFK